MLTNKKHYKGGCSPEALIEGGGSEISFFLGAQSRCEEPDKERATKKKKERWRRGEKKKEAAWQKTHRIKTNAHGFKRTRVLGGEKKRDANLRKKKHESGLV